MPFLQERPQVFLLGLEENIREFPKHQLLKQFSKVAGRVVYVKLLPEYLLPTSSAGARRTGQTKYQSIINHPCQGPGLHGRSANFRMGNRSEQLAKTTDLLLDQRSYGFRGIIPRAKSCATGNQHNLHFFVGYPLAYQGAYGVYVVFHEIPGSQFMAALK
jgi:hypothetical protein